ncbi:integrase catalytic domain-containing protein [Trichonephila clavipes]|nr:integrase catalytic domain-containing protein [Trichonephila clavipes]
MVEKLIMIKHLQLEHAGTQTLMSCLRESFWIIKSRKTVRGVIKRCTKCRRFSARPLEAKIDWKNIENFASEKRISWKFSPPAAPWWDGFWERLIGLLKNILRKVLGRACLSEEELVTAMRRRELNSRPLTYLSEDPDELSALTPSMFLQEIREVGVPDLDMIDSK